MKTLQEVLIEGRNCLKEADIAEYQLDAWYLMEFCFGITKTQYFIRQQETVLSEQYETYKNMIKKRAEHIPLQYLTKEQEFMGLSFLVNEHVLIPRQDTEILVEEVLKKADGKRVLDMCTGSGCILISIAKQCSIKEAVGVDISEQALNVAKENGNRHKTEIRWIQSNLFEQVTGEYDIIVSNPPYIETKEIETLMPEVRFHEPMLALDGKEDGFYFYEQIIEKSDLFLTKGGFIFFEIGYNQGEKVKELLEKKGYENIQIKQDLAGLDRVVYGKRK